MNLVQHHLRFQQLLLLPTCNHVSQAWLGNYDGYDGYREGYLRLGSRGRR